MCHSLHTGKPLILLVTHFISHLEISLWKHLLNRVSESVKLSRRIRKRSNLWELLTVSELLFFLRRFVARSPSYDTSTNKYRADQRWTRGWINIWPNDAGKLPKALCLFLLTATAVPIVPPFVATLIYAATSRRQKIINHMKWNCVLACNNFSYLLYSSICLYKHYFEAQKTYCWLYVTA